MKAHNDGMASRFGPIEFRRSSVQEMDGEVRAMPLPCCSYCGSLTIDDALKAFQTPGVRWSGSDWKYGWPHKFYIEIPCEPYTRCVSSANHKPGYGEWVQADGDRWVQYATPEQIAEWNRVAAPLTGIVFEIDAERGLKYRAPCHGYQADGVIA